MSDSSVVFSVVLDEKGGAQPTSPDDLEGRSPAWLHLDSTGRETGQILEQQGIESFVADTMMALESRPHTVRSGEGLLVILRCINLNAGADPEDMVSIRIWVEPRRIVSVRYRPIRAAQTILEQLNEGRGPRSVAELVIAITEKLTDSIAEFVEDIEVRMDAYEQRIEDEATTEIRGEISSIRRQLAVVRRYLAPQRDALDALYRLAGNLLDEEEVFTLREQAHRMTRYVEDLDLVRERALVAQEELKNRIAQEQNARTYVFSVVATIFLPLTFITGIFGMNTAGLPGMEDESATIIVAGIMVAIAVALIVWLRFKKWF